MEEKIKIQMFGIKDEVIEEQCCCGPGTDCGPSEDPTTIPAFSGKVDSYKAYRVLQRM